MDMKRRLLERRKYLLLGLAKNGICRVGLLDGEYYIRSDPYLIYKRFTGFEHPASVLCAKSQIGR